MSKYSATQQVNFTKNSDPQQGISLCIPRVFNNIGWRRIKQHIIEANLGFVERIDVVQVAEGKYKRAFVHFAPGKWNMRDSTARDALKALQSGAKIKLEYESPWYWLVGISGAARPAEAPKPRERRERKTQVNIEPKSEDKLPVVSQLKENPLNDPIVARSMSNNSPESNAKVSDERMDMMVGIKEFEEKNQMQREMESAVDN
jgi:hypothetical protein